MARIPKLTPSAQRLIATAVDVLFDRAKARILGHGAQKLYGKQLVFRFNADTSLTALFNAASAQEGVRPNEETLLTLLKIAGSYLDATRERTKARVAKQVQSFLMDAVASGVKTDVKTVLGGQLATVWGDVQRDVRRIVETETTVVRNFGIHDAIDRIAASTGVEDPSVFFVTVRDDSRCPECTRLHVMPDGVTPRVWKMSQLGSGYHKKGEENPKVAGLHPHCRCCLTHLMPGYGFDSIGRIRYVAPGHDEYGAQRGFGKSEPLNKAVNWSHFTAELARHGWTTSVEGNKHHELSNPAFNIPGPRIQNMHWKKKMESGAAEKYLRQVGLRLRPDGNVEVNEHDSGQTQHDYAEHYRRLGLTRRKEAAQPSIRSWTPETPHKHIPIDQIDMPEAPSDWKVDKFVGLLAGPNANKVAPIHVQQQPDGRYKVLEGAHRFGAAYLSEFSHVPAVSSPRPP